MVAKKRFTEEEDKYIIEHYGKQSNSDIARTLNKKATSVFSKVTALIKAGRLISQRNKINYPKKNKETLAVISNTSQKSKIKIIINEEEFYVINIPTELTIRELPIITDRFNKISKFLGRDMVLESISNPDFNSNKEKKHYNLAGNSKLWTKDRNETLKLIKLHYTANLDEKKAYAKKHNIAWEVLCSRMWGLRKKWDIKPQEIGLKEFMPRGHFQSKSNQVANPITKKTRISRPFSKNRELSKQIIHTHYWGTDEQKQAIATQYNIKWEQLMRSVAYLTKKWKMTPQEIGLKEFPNGQTFGDFKKDKEKWKIN